MNDYNFKVNLDGMIKILSDHLYSTPDVYIRELLQNAIDAIAGRKEADPGFSSGSITLEIEEGVSLIFTDNGLGLTQDEIHRFLAIIGESSKSGTLDPDLGTSYIGQFGIGLLSCFMVSSEIRITTHSIKENHSYEWIGRPDGSYQVHRLDIPVAIGTSVYLTCREGQEDFFKKEKIKYLIQYYGMLLPCPITLKSHGEEETIYPVHLPWEDHNPSKEELLFFGSYVFHETFLDCILLSSEAGGLKGVAYIVPYRVQPSARQNHKIYLKNMLLTEKIDNFLPDWAVFVKCVVNTTRLHPTASRESFYEDDVLRDTREGLGNTILSYLKNLAIQKNHIFYQFIDIHSLAVKSMAIERDDVFLAFIDYLEFSTTRGQKTGYELRTCGEPLMYVVQMDEYKQLSQIFFARGRLLINACYVYAVELLYRMAETFNIEAVPAAPEDIEDLMLPLTIKEEQQTFDFVRQAEQIMHRYSCCVEVKKFAPVTQPVFYYLSNEAKQCRQIEQSRSNSDPMFHNMLNSFLQEQKQTSEAILYFNFDNIIFKKLCGITKEKSLEAIVEILYVQALLIGGYPLHNDELSLMNSRILDLLEHSDF